MAVGAVAGGATDPQVAGTSREPQHRGSSLVPAVSRLFVGSLPVSIFAAMLTGDQAHLTQASSRALNGTSLDSLKLHRIHTRFCWLSLAILLFKRFQSPPPA